jgi:hypothetical protein
MSKIQDGWRSCPKCQGMHYGVFPNFKGVCPAGGEHEQTNSFAYTMDFDSAPGNNIQMGWTSCPKCQGMHFGPGACPGADTPGGPHVQTGSFAYSMLFDLPIVLQSGWTDIQSGWRSCKNCQGLFFGPFGGKCPKNGGAHDATGSFDYTMRVAVPEIASLLPLQDENGNDFYQVTGINFTTQSAVNLDYIITDTIGDETSVDGALVTSDGTGGFIFPIDVQDQPHSVKVKATDVATGGVAEKSREAP